MAAIYITAEDMKRLETLIDGLKAGGSGELPHIAALEEELDRAQVVDSKSVASDVITLGSLVRLQDPGTGELKEYEVVFPNTKPRFGAHALSVLAPLGAALLGARAGETVEWRAPAGMRRIQITQVLYQPEAANASVA